MELTDDEIQYLRDKIYKERMEEAIKRESKT